MRQDKQGNFWPPGSLGGSQLSVTPLPQPRPERFQRLPAPCRLLSQLPLPAASAGTGAGLGLRSRRAGAQRGQRSSRPLPCEPMPTSASSSLFRHSKQPPSLPAQRAAFLNKKRGRTGAHGKEARRAPGNFSPAPHGHPPAPRYLQLRAGGAPAAGAAPGPFPPARRCRCRCRYAPAALLMDGGGGGVRERRSGDRDAPAHPRLAARGRNLSNLLKNGGG